MAYHLGMRRDESKGNYQTMSLFDYAPAIQPVTPPQPRLPLQPIPATGKLEIYFDGGCLGNPGKKYGSFLVKLDGREILKRSRVDFGHGTNNEAEFNALKLALDEAVAWLQAHGHELKQLSLLVETDSTIVRNRLVVKNIIFKKFPSSERMFNLANECLTILRLFGKYEVTWKGRASNVAKFGH